MLLFKSKNFILMNNQITRRNLLKLLGVSGVTLPLSGISKDLASNPLPSNQPEQPNITKYPTKTN